MYDRGAMPEGARAMAKRLGKLRILRREVDFLSQRAAELELRAQGGVGRITGMPFSRRSDRVGEYGAELARLYQFIDDIEDPELRLIFSRRYIDGLSWLGVAQKIGRTDEQLPRKLHNAYLRARCGTSSPGASFPAELLHTLSREGG